MDSIGLVRGLLDHAGHCEAASLRLNFVDLEKAFGSVSREGLWSVLERYGVTPEMLAVLRSYHGDMEAQVRVGGHLSEPFPCKIGVRQGCLMAPVLLNLYCAAVLADWHARIVPNANAQSDTQFRLGQKAAPFPPGRAPVCGTCYAHDTTLIASAWATSKSHCHHFVNILTRFGLVLSIKTTKWVAAGKDDAAGAELRVQQGAVEGICERSQFKHLGSTLHQEGEWATELSAFPRLGAAGAPWRSLIWPWWPPHPAADERTHI
eukprot:gene10879-gene1903